MALQVKSFMIVMALQVQTAIIFMALHTRENYMDLVLIVQFYVSTYILLKCLLQSIVRSSSVKNKNAQQCHKKILRWRKS